MKRQMKVFLGIFTFCLCALPFTNVNAADYGDEILTELSNDGASLTLNSGDTVTVGGTQYVGANGYFNVEDGNVVFTNNKGNLQMEVNGTLNSLHEKNLMYFTYGGIKIPINLVVNEGAILNLTGNMALTTGTPVTLTNNGTVNIEGNLEVRAGSTYTGTGVTNLYGNLAVYGTAGGNLASTITLYDGANVYSESDVAANLAIGEQNTDEYTWSMGENSKSYVSISEGVSNNFGYGYTLTKTDVPTTEVTTPTEDTTDNAEEVTNPKTADSILLITLALLVSGGVAAFAGRKLVKQRM